MLRSARQTWTTLMADYGMLAVLAILCVYFCLATIAEQHPTGAPAGETVAAAIRSAHGDAARVLIVTRDNPEENAYAKTLRTRLAEHGGTVIDIASGPPAAARAAIERAAASTSRDGKLDALACTRSTSTWTFVEKLSETFPALAGTAVVTPKSSTWPNFLKADNLLNIANQIAVIAIIAIGMTMVIITAGIDLSVGSLIAFSAVVSTLFIRDFAGAESAGAFGMTVCCLAGIAICGLVGAFTGSMVTAFRIPPFIVTLAMMLVGSGLAYQIAEGQSIYQLPDSFVWLGREATLFGIPNAVVLMVVLYVLAHIVMAHTALGRYIYAVGGNLEAARLSGVPYRRVLVLVYTMSAALAGLGGVIMASQLKSGSPTYGQMYELFVIAAVVVGGTSLHGGEGKIFGTLIGAFIIAVIRNGMNLTGVESYTQNVVLGFVILAAVLLDTVKRGGQLELVIGGLRLGRGTKKAESS